MKNPEPNPQLPLDHELQHIAHSLTTDFHLQQDLLQEARLWLWRTTLQPTSHSAGWHCHDCLLHLKNCLRAGRSIDSHKRRAHACPLGEESPEADDEHTPHPALVAGHDVPAGIIEQDCINSLMPHLNPAQQKILRLRLEGYTTRDIARVLHISQSAAARARRAIADAARRSGALS